MRNSKKYQKERTISEPVDNLNLQTSWQIVNYLYEKVNRKEDASVCVCVSVYARAHVNKGKY